MNESSELRDRIAREAARLYEQGRADTIGGAIAHAIHEGSLPHVSGDSRPSWGHVRKHLRGMAMQALGSEGYEARQREVWEIAEQVMTLLEEFDPLFVGRAARGQIDGGASIYIRIYTRDPIESLAQLLVDFGYAEPAFDTINTSHGRMNRVLFEDEGWEVVITRCLPKMRKDAKRNLVRAGKVTIVTPRELRKRLGR